MKTIERYIQFAIDNGLNITIYWYAITNIKLIADDKRNYLELITSKPFIEAIARGLHKENNYTDWIALSVDFLTKDQAIAIREGQEALDTFINNILSND